MKVLKEFTLPSISEIYLYDANGNLEEDDIAKFASKSTDTTLQERLKELGMTLQQFQVLFEMKDWKKYVNIFRIHSIK